MPIFLEAPSNRPGGPDGQGWNRLSVGWDPVASQCALQPRSWQSLWETLNRGGRTARFGDFLWCVGDSQWAPDPERLRAGDCGNCPIYRRHGDEPTTLTAGLPTILVRLMPRDRDLRRQPTNGGSDDTPHVMNKPEDGWSSFSYRWTWNELARLVGWKVGRFHRDQHGIGFWLVKEDPSTLNGLPDGPAAGPGLRNIDREV